MRLGLVGCGRLAELGYVPAAALAGLEIAAVADPDEGRRELVAAAAGTTARFASATELVASGVTDGVVIASPAAAHEEDAAACSEAGVPTLVEKPPAPNHAAAVRIAGLDPAPWIGFNRRFQQGLAIAPAVLRGRDTSVELLLHYRRDSWRPHRVDDPALLDLAPHLVDLALLWCGRAEGVTARSESPARVVIALECERGHARIDCASDRPHRESVDAEWAGGSARWDQGGLLSGVLARVRRGPHPLVASLAAQLESFVRATGGGDPGPLATAADGAAVMAVIGAAAASIEQGGAAVVPALEAVV
jgi:predicted dehydrogenase